MGNNQALHIPIENEMPQFKQRRTQSVRNFKLSILGSGDRTADSVRNKEFWLRGQQDPGYSTSRSPHHIRQSSRLSKHASFYSNVQEDFTSIIKLKKMQPEQDYKPIIKQVKKEKYYTKPQTSMKSSKVCYINGQGIQPDVQLEDSSVETESQIDFMDDEKSANIHDFKAIQKKNFDNFEYDQDESLEIHPEEEEHYEEESLEVEVVEDVEVEKGIIFASNDKNQMINQGYSQSNQSQEVQPIKFQDQPSIQEPEMIFIPFSPVAKKPTSLIISTPSTKASIKYRFTSPNTPIVKPFLKPAEKLIKKPKEKSIYKARILPLQQPKKLKNQRPEINRRTTLTPKFESKIKIPIKLNQQRPSQQYTEIKKSIIDPRTILRPLEFQKKPKQFKSQVQSPVKREQSQEKPKIDVLNAYISQAEQDFGANDPVLSQGEIYRFKPGYESNFIPRWIQISQRAFRYFKNQYATFGGMCKPIVSFPKQAIEDVCITQVNADEFMKRRNVKELEKTLFKYMFEVYLREDYEDICLYREQHRNNSRSLSKKNSQKSLDVTAQHPFQQQNNGLNKSVNLSFYSPDRKRNNSLYNFSRQRSTSNFRSQHRDRSMNLDKSHLDLLYDDFPKYNKKLLEHERDKRISIIDVNNRADEYEHDKVNRIVRGHLMPVRDFNLGDQKQAYLEDQRILNKQFGEKQQGTDFKFIQNNVSAWSSRQQDWYNSERRIIFATTSEFDRQQWIKYFKGQIVYKPKNNKKLRV
eukprot:403331507